jgi:hypothetical protein
MGAMRTDASVLISVGSLVIRLISILTALRKYSLLHLPYVDMVGFIGSTENTSFSVRVERDRSPRWNEWLAADGADRFLGI